MIDSLRFRVHLGERLGVNPASVDAMAIGEHGTSEVLLWSSATVAGLSVQAVLQGRGESFDTVRECIERDVTFANSAIIEGNKASQYGIGIARLAEAVLRDERAIFPVATHQETYGVTLALPSVLGRGGVIRVLEPAMSTDERKALEQSAARLKAAEDRLHIGAA